MATPMTRGGAAKGRSQDALLLEHWGVARVFTKGQGIWYRICSLGGLRPHEPTRGWDTANVCVAEFACHLPWNVVNDATAGEVSNKCACECMCVCARRSLCACVSLTPQQLFALVCSLTFARGEPECPVKPTHRNEK